MGRDITPGRGVLTCVVVLTFAAPATGQSMCSAGQIVRYVDDDAPWQGDGRSWATAYRCLQDALLEAASNPAITEIRIGAGTYHPDEDELNRVDPGDRRASFHLLDGVTIAGGYRGWNHLPAADSRAPSTHPSILSGDLFADDLPGDLPGGAARADNAYHVVSGHAVDATAVLAGFTITGGNADGPWFARHNTGGGLCTTNGSPTIVACAFVANAADFNDVSYGLGGAVSTQGGSPTLVNCTFTGNTAGFGFGGAVAGINGRPAIINCTFDGNWSWSGGALYVEHCDLVMINCTLVGNTAASQVGGGLYIVNSQPTLINSILWQNSPNALLATGGDPVVRYSIIEGDHAGEGNLDADPCLADPAIGDFRLRPDSPGIDAGDPGHLTGPGATDASGHPRILCGRVDIGAYEFGMGDFDCNRVVDAADFLGWRDCMAGPIDAFYGAGCPAFDFDCDGDVDVRDFAQFGTLIGP